MPEFPPGSDPLTQPVAGRCLCGSVEITLEGARPLVDVCHCRMCQRWSGGTFGGVSGEDARVEGGEFVTAYRSSEWAERAFCSRCGSNLWYRFIPTGHRSFLAGLFELPEGFRMWRQIFVDEKPEWFDFAQDTPMLTGTEVIAEAKAEGFEFD